MSSGEYHELGFSANRYFLLPAGRIAVPFLGLPLDLFADLFLLMCSVKAFHQMKKYYVAIDDNASALQLTNHTSWLKRHVIAGHFHFSLQLCFFVSYPSLCSWLRFNNESVHYVGLFMDIIEQAAFLTAGEAVQWEMVPGAVVFLCVSSFQIFGRFPYLMRCGVFDLRLHPVIICVSVSVETQDEP